MLRAVCVCIVCTVNLRHAGPCDKLLAFARINKRTNHIDVAVDDVVLRVLVNAVYAFFCNITAISGPATPET